MMIINNNHCSLLVLLVICLLIISQVQSFRGYGVRSSSKVISRINIDSSSSYKDKLSTTGLQMGLFDFFGPKKSASASHILVKGKQGKDFLTNLKREIEMSKNIKDSFAEAG